MYLGHLASGGEYAYSNFVATNLINIISKEMVYPRKRVNIITPNPIDKEKIDLKLKAFRLVAEANVDLLENDVLLKEQLNLKMQMVQDLLNELDVYEKSGDQIEYDCALGSAKILIKDISDLVNQLLTQPIT